MKYIFITFLFIKLSHAFTQCKTIESTLALVSVKGCPGCKLCVGYAECDFGKKEKTVGRIICKAEKNLNCPNANDCLEEAFNSGNIAITTQPQNDPRGIYQYCPSQKKLAPARNNGTDVVNSRFCNVHSGDYSQKIGDLPTQMTGTDGGGRQMGSGRR